MGRSFFGKILRVDLSSGQITIKEPRTVYYRRYMGGWNIIADLLLREVPPGADPLGPANKLIFAPGLLTGLPVSGWRAARLGPSRP